MSKHASCPPTRASRIPTSSSNGVAAQAPSGTVTFLFTDIEGSTRLWEGDRVEMKAALARHDAICETRSAAHDGFVSRPAATVSPPRSRARTTQSSARPKCSARLDGRDCRRCESEYIPARLRNEPRTTSVRP